MSLLSVSEIFGPTFQGEGPNAGSQCVFIRLGGCGLGCVWCDSARTWRFSNSKFHNDDIIYDRNAELTKLTHREAFDKLKDLGRTIKHVVVTGGEPLLQQDHLRDLFELFSMHSWKVEVETAGVIRPDALADFPATWYNVSPKTQTSGNTLVERYKPRVLGEFLKLPSCFKFVVTCEHDFEEVDWIVRTIEIPTNRIWIMPEGVSVEKIIAGMRLLAPLTLSRGYNLTTRTQILIWDNIRGV